MTRVLCCLLVIVLSACATDNYIAYSGPTRPRAEVAIIQGSGTHSHKVLKGLDEGVAILEVDGKATTAVWGGNYATRVTVLPGRHVLRVRWGYFGSKADATLWVDCRAGGTYFVARRVEGERVRLWVEDAATGAIVGGVPTEEPRQ